jgi:hypothetical protein
VARASTHPRGVTSETSVSGGQRGSTAPAGTLAVHVRAPFRSSSVAVSGCGPIASACATAGIAR